MVSTAITLYKRSFDSKSGDDNTPSQSSKNKRWSLKYGPTMLSIQDAQSVIPLGDTRFIVCLFIRRKLGNERVKFIDISTSLEDEWQLGKKLYNFFTYKVHNNEKMKDRDDPYYKHIIEEQDGIFSIYLEDKHTYITYGKALSENEKYQDSLSGYLNFIYRDSPEDLDEFPINLLVDKSCFNNS